LGGREKKTSVIKQKEKQDWISVIHHRGEKVEKLKTLEIWFDGEKCCETARKPKTPQEISMEDSQGGGGIRLVRGG